MNTNRETDERSTMKTCNTCGRPANARYTNEAANEACVDRAHDPHLTVAQRLHAETTRAAIAARPRRIVYRQATTGKLHRRKSCSITSRTRYDHFEVEFTPEIEAAAPRCDKCWDGYTPAATAAGH